MRKFILALVFVFGCILDLAILVVPVVLPLVLSFQTGDFHYMFLLFLLIVTLPISVLVEVTLGSIISVIVEYGE